MGLGVDGSASNDSSNLMEGVRHALMINHRLTYGAEAVTHLDALRWATEGSAACLGRSDIGRIAPGREADLALFTLDELRFSASPRPLAALVLCGATRPTGDGRGALAGDRRAAARVDTGMLREAHSRWRGLVRGRVGGPDPTRSVIASAATQGSARSPDAVFPGLLRSARNDERRGPPVGEPARRFSEQPVDLPVGVEPDRVGAGTRGRPGMVMISPQIATTKPAPAESRTSRTPTMWPSGAPIRVGSVEKEYWVLAMQIGRWP